MSPLNLSQSDIIAYDGTSVRLVYDPEASEVSKPSVNQA
jgi:hypothetical protein